LKTNGETTALVFTQQTLQVPTTTHANNRFIDKVHVTVDLKCS